MSEIIVLNETKSVRKLNVRKKRPTFFAGNVNSSVSDETVKFVALSISRLPRSVQQKSEIPSCYRFGNVAALYVAQVVHDQPGNTPY